MSKIIGIESKGNEMNYVQVLVLLKHLCPTSL